ncbi:MAG: hypothetical protein GEU99_22530 [Luteitalea sp.]|nr:hypothetical protein [Luteitalea sp.]
MTHDSRTGARPASISSPEFRTFAFTIAGIVVVTWLFNNTVGSLIPVLLFHAAQNSASVFELHFPALAGSAWSWCPHWSYSLSGR